MSKQNSDTISIKNLDMLREIDEKTAETVNGGIDWICMWPEDPTGTYYPVGKVPGSYISEGTWHYFDYTQARWINSWYSCYPVGIIATT